MSSELSWDLFARDNASAAFNIAAQSANRLAEDSQHAVDNLRQLGRQSPDVRISTNAPEAAAEIAALRGEIDRLNSSAHDATSGGGGLADFVPYLAALAPEALGAAEAIGAVGVGLGATLYLGAKGALAQLKQLTPEFHQLQAAAAKSLAPGVNSLIDAAHKLQPQLTQMVGVFGKAISSEVSGISKALANGGFQEFLAYAEKELPVVLHTVNDLGAALLRLGVDLAPFGDSLLKDLGILGNMLNDTLQLAGDFGHVASKAAGSSGQSGGFLSAALGIGPGQVTQNLQHAQEGLDKLTQAFNTNRVVQGQGTASATAYAAAAIEATKAMMNQAEPVKAAMNAIRQDEAAVKDLTAAYQGLIDKTLQETTTSLGFKAGLLGLTAQVKSNGSSLSENTQKGIANRQMLVGLLSQAEANAKGSKDYGRVLLDNVQQFIQFATHAGYSKDAIDRLLTSLHLMPAQIRTSVSVLTGAAKANLDFIEKQIAQLPSYKTITINTQYTTSGGSPLAPRGSTYNSQVPQHHAAGGLIHGAGSGTSDSILSYLSNGEFVMNAGATRKWLPLLRVLNGGLANDWHGVYSRRFFNQLTAPAQAALQNLTTVIHSQVNKQETVLKNAQANLHSLILQRRQAIGSLSSNLQGGASLGGLFGTDAFGNPMVANVNTFLSGQASQLKRFARDLKWARNRGLSTALLQEIAGLGAVQGDQVLQEFITGQANISAANREQASILAYSRSAATTVEDKVYAGRVARDTKEVRKQTHILEEMRKIMEREERRAARGLETHITIDAKTHKPVLDRKYVLELIKAIRREERTAGKRLV